MGYAEMLKDDLPENSPLQGHVDEILNATARSKELVKQILSFSRQDDLNLQPIKLQPIVRDLSQNRSTGRSWLKPSEGC